MARYPWSEGGDLGVSRMVGQHGRSCIFCGGPTVITKEGLNKCQACLHTFQTGGANYRIVEER